VGRQIATVCKLEAVHMKFRLPMHCCIRVVLACRTIQHVASLGRHSARCTEITFWQD
jgi:hypothetical protein